MHHLSDQLVVISTIWWLVATIISNRLLNVGPYARKTSQAWNAHEWDTR